MKKGLKYIILLSILFVSCTSNRIENIKASYEEGINSLKLTWDYEGEDSEFEIRYWKLSEKREPIISKGNIKEKEIIIKHLDFDVEYKIIIKSINNKGKKSKGSEISVLIPSDKTPPKEVLNLNYSFNKDGVFTLYWENPADADFDSVDLLIGERNINLKMSPYITILDEAKKVYIKTRDKEGNISKGLEIEPEVNILDEEFFKEIKAVEYPDFKYVEWLSNEELTDFVEIISFDENYQILKSLDKGSGFIIPFDKTKKKSKYFLRGVNKDNSSGDLIPVEFTETAYNENRVKDIAISNDFTLFLNEKGDLFYSGLYKFINGSDWYYVSDSLEFIASNVVKVDAISEGAFYLTEDNKLWSLRYVNRDILKRVYEGEEDIASLVSDNVMDFFVSETSIEYLKVDSILCKNKIDMNGYLSYDTSTSRVSEDYKLKEKYSSAKYSKSYGMGSATYLYIDNEYNLWARGKNDYGKFGTGDTKEIDKRRIIAKDIINFWYSENRLFIMNKSGNVLAAGSNRYNNFGNGLRNEEHTFIPIITSLGEPVERKPWKEIFGEAIESRSVEQFNKLIDDNKDKYWLTKYDNNPLSYAIRVRDFELIRFLLKTNIPKEILMNDRGADMDHKTYLDLVIDLKDYEMSKFLINNGYPQEKLELSLFNSIHKKDNKTLESLLIAGVDPNSYLYPRTSNAEILFKYNTALTYANKFNSSAIPILLEYGANPNIPSTTINLMAYDSKLSIIREYISYKNKPDYDLETVKNIEPVIKGDVLEDNIKLYNSVFVGKGNVTRSDDFILLDKDTTVYIIEQGQYFTYCITESGEKGYIEYGKVSIGYF